VIALGAVWNIAGIRVVGDGSVALGAFLLAPFAIMCGYGLFHTGQVAVAPPITLDKLGALSVAMWNYMGWDNASTIAGEVEEPQRNYPRAMLITTALIAVVYMIPVAVAQFAGLDPSHWSTGAWAEAAAALGGPWLGLAVVVGGMLCGVGMTNALVLSYTRVPFAMAEDGFLPAAFTRVHPTTRAPWVSIVACAVAWTLCLPLGFERLVLIDIILYGGSLLLEFVALVVLRVREPQLPRPFRVPGGVLGAAALGIGPVFLLALALVRGYGEQAGPVSALTFGILLAAAGVGVYVLMRRRKAPAS
jgi:amino acid transporter